MDSAYCIYIISLVYIKVLIKEEKAVHCWEDKGVTWEGLREGVWEEVEGRREKGK